MKTKSNMERQWEIVMPVLIDALHSKDKDRVAIATEELMRLAKLVDKANSQ